MRSSSWLGTSLVFLQPISCFESFDQILRLGRQRRAAISAGGALQPIFRFDLWNDTALGTEDGPKANQRSR